jgi:S1-C subfamily serine protease
MTFGAMATESRDLAGPARDGVVVVVGVADASDAHDVGFRAGDLIENVNLTPVKTPADVVQALESARRAGHSNALLLARRCTRRVWAPLLLNPKPG